MDARRLRLAPAEQAAAEEQVRRRRVSDLRAGGGDLGAIGVVEPDAVREDAPRVQQADRGVDVEVAARFREQLVHPAHLGTVLGDVGLQVERGVGAAQPTGEGELLARARRREAHRHRVGEAAAAVPARDQVLHLALGGGDVVDQVGRGVAVHQHLAGDDTHAARLGGGEERIDRGGVHGREDDRRGRAVGEQRVEEVRRCRVGVRDVGVARLGRKGVRRQPVEQLGPVAGDDVDLRTVDVGVDEAWQDQAAGMVVALPVFAGRLGLHGDDPPRLGEQPVAGAKAHRRRVDVAPRRVGAEIEQVAVDGDARRGVGAARRGGRGKAGWHANHVYTIAIVR